MLIYDEFVFLHMPKTAGTFITQALREELSPPVEQLETHTGWEEIPAAAQGRPVLAYVRNPWDWYVSWYHFWTQLWLPKQSPAVIHGAPVVRLFFGESIEITDEGGLRGIKDFPTVVRGACENLDPAHPVMAQLIEEGAPQIQAIEFGDDFYTARFKNLVGAGLDTDLLTVGRFESLVDDLERFLVRHAIPHDDDLIPRIRARQPVNVNVHRPYREYYDEELRDLVGDSCRTLIETFDYRF